MSPQAVSALLSADLLRRLADGRFGLSPAGRARAERLKAQRGTRSTDLPEAETRAQHGFQAQHQMRETESLMESDTAGRQDKVTVNRAESPLGWLRRRRNGRGEAYLSARQVEAGERLRNDFEIAGLSPKMTASWTGIPVDKGRRQPTESDPTLKQVAARQRFQQAVTALGPDLGDVAVRVCCCLDGLETVEKRHGWPVRSAKVVLAIALDRLAEHYGFGENGNREKGQS